MKSIFAQRLKEMRIANNLTQEKLAARLDYGYTAIANYESGRNEPSISDFARLCEALNASADYLLGLSDVRRPYAVADRQLLEDLMERAHALEMHCAALLKR